MSDYAHAGLTNAREQLALEQTENWRLKNAKLRGELMPRTEHERALRNEAAAFKKAMLGLPAAIAKELPTLTRSDRLTIDRVVREALNKLAEEQ